MKRGFTLWELVVLLACLGLVAALLYPVATPSNTDPRRSSCQSNLKNVGLGFWQYVQDYDEFLPPAREGKTGRGWVDSLDPYMKDGSVYACPSHAGGDYSVRPRRTDYFMNARLSGYSLNRLGQTSNTVITGEGGSGMNAANPTYAIASYASLGPETEARFRNAHKEGSNHGFVDGHVRWLRATEPVGTANPQRVPYTFAPR